MSNIHEEKSEPRTVYPYVAFLDGNFGEHGHLEVFNHLKDVLKNQRYKIESLETRGFKIKSFQPIDRETIGLGNLEIDLIKGPDFEHPDDAELALFSSKPVNVRDLLNAGVHGVYRVRKWSPSRNGSPNTGYSVLFYNEIFASAAYKSAPYLVNGKQRELVPVAPYEFRRQGTKAKQDYWKLRRQAMATSKIPLTFWTRASALTDNILAHLPSNEVEQGSDKLREEVELLQARLDRVENVKLVSLAAQVDKNSEDIQMNQVQLNLFAEEFSKMDGTIKQNNRMLQDLSGVPALLAQLANKDRHSEYSQAEAPRHIKRRSSDFWQGQDDIYQLEESWNEKVKSKKIHTERKMELDSKQEEKVDHFILVKGPDNNLMSFSSKEYNTIGEVRAAMCQRWQCTGSISSNGIIVKDVVAIASFPIGKTLSFNPHIIGGSDSPRSTEQDQPRIDQYFRRRSGSPFIANPADELNTEEKESSLNASAEPFHMPSNPSNLQQTTLEESFFPSAPDTTDNKEEKDTHCLKVLQWNCYHLTGEKVHYLSQVTRNQSIDVILLQEVSAVQNKRAPKRIPGFHAPRYVRPSGSKGLAAYVRKGIYWTASDTIFDKNHPHILHQSITIRLEDEDTEIRLENVYIHNDASNSERLELWNFIANLESEFHLVMGDINERAAILGGGNTNQVASFDDLISNQGYSVVNTGEPTRIQIHGSSWKESAIDVTLGSAAVMEKISSWSLEDESSSDHRPIITTLDFAMTSSPQRSKVPKVPYEELRSKFKQLYTDGRGRPGAKFWTALMELRDYRPSFVRSRGPARWWSKRLAALRRRRDRARRRRREDEFVRLRREFRREVKKAQRKYEERVLNTRASEGVPSKMLKEVYPGLRKKRRIGHALDSREAKNQAQELANTYATLMTTRAKVHRRGREPIGRRPIGRTPAMDFAQLEEERERTFSQARLHNPSPQQSESENGIRIALGRFPAEIRPVLSDDDDFDSQNDERMRRSGE